MRFSTDIDHELNDQLQYKNNFTQPPRQFTKCPIFCWWLLLRGKLLKRGIKKGWIEILPRIKSNILWKTKAKIVGDFLSCNRKTTISSKWGKIISLQRLFSVWLMWISPWLYVFLTNVITLTNTRLQFWSVSSALQVWCVEFGVRCCFLTLLALAQEKRIIYFDHNTDVLQRSHKKNCLNSWNKISAHLVALWSRVIAIVLAQILTIIIVATPRRGCRTHHQRKWPRIHYVKSDRKRWDREKDWTDLTSSSLWQRFWFV